MRQPMAQAHTFKQCRGTLAGFADRRTANQQRHADVFQSGKLRQQMVKLINETQRAVTQQAALFFIQRRQLLARQPHAAGAGRIQTAQHIEQGALARAGAADNRHALAGV